MADEALEELLPSEPTKWTDQRLDEFFEAYKPHAICDLFTAQQVRIKELEAERDHWREMRRVAEEKSMIMSDKYIALEAELDELREELLKVLDKVLESEEHTQFSGEKDNG